jgi:hypothetical protein
MQNKITTLEGKSLPLVQEKGIEQKWIIKALEISAIRKIMLEQGKMSNFKPQPSVTKLENQVETHFDKEHFLLTFAAGNMFDSLDLKVGKANITAQASKIFILKNDELILRYQKGQITQSEFEMANYILKHQYQELIKQK